jgi:hypothetical protein
VGAGIAVILLSFAAFRIFTKAEVQDFYPSVCLGTWENVEGASGVPENFEPSLAVEGFTPQNSAIYRLPESKIFCGAFLPPSEETKGNITNVALTFIWRVGELPPPQEPVGVVETPPTVESESDSVQEPPLPADTGDAAEEEPATEEANNDTAPSSEPTSPPEPVVHQPTPLPAPSPISEPAGEAAPPQPPVEEPSARIDLGSFTLLPLRALAQEGQVVEALPEASDAPPVTAELSGEPAPAAEPEPAAPEEPIVLPPLTMELAPASTSTNENTPPSDELVFTLPPLPAPDENFLKISYSVDGESWFEIGKVHPMNWQNFTARLPVSRWDELKRLQIAVEGIPTTLNPVPPVYLAGMFIEVNYELPPIFGTEDSLDEPTDGLPILRAPNAIQALPGRGDESVFGVGERVEFDIVLDELPTSDSDAHSEDTPSDSETETDTGDLPTGESAPSEAIVSESPPVLPSEETETSPSPPPAEPSGTASSSAPVENAPADSVGDAGAPVVGTEV